MLKLMCVNSSVMSDFCNSMHGLSLEFAKQVYKSGLPFPSSGDYPHLAMEPGYPVLQVDSLPSEIAGTGIAGTAYDWTNIYVRLLLLL